MTEAFPDRRDQLFGREADVHRLTDRARRPGLTAVVARPLMGKTWALNEVARRLLEEGRYLVGYHESKAAESSHLLYAVSNLYARWLADSTMRDQAISLWKRHKESLVPRIGQMVGTLFEKLGGKQLPEGVAAIVRVAFDGLAEAQRDLLSGGIQIPALPYDQALSLTNLVAKVSERRVVLILDAWEKSPSVRSEFATLEAFLKHLDAWPHTHVFLAVRNPELDSTKVDDEAYRRTSALCKINRAAVVYELPPMDQEDPKERVRIARFVRDRVPAAKDQTEESILEMIDGYPGVLDFWTNEANRTAMQTEEDLQNEASNAQALRYLELDQHLNGLHETQCTLAARLAFFPRLDVETWTTFRELLLKDQSDAVVNALIDSKALNDESFPTYGHDTRHAAARRWFIEHKRPLFRRISEQIVESLASRITGADSASLPFFEALVGCSEAAQQVGANQTICCLLDAAQAAFFGAFEAISHREFDDLYPRAIQRNGSFVPLVAVALIGRGLTKGFRGDSDEAIADYTAAIELPNAPADVLALALFFRGAMKGERGDSDEAIADYTAAIELPGAPADDVALALRNRGRMKRERGDSDGAIADYTAAIELPNAPAHLVAQVLDYRADLKRERGDSDGAIADYTAAIESPDASADDVAQALCDRGVAKGERGDRDGAIADFTAAIELPNAPANVVEAARRNLAEAVPPREESKRRRGRPF